MHKKHYNVSTIIDPEGGESEISTYCKSEASDDECGVEVKHRNSSL